MLEFRSIVSRGVGLSESLDLAIGFTDLIFALDSIPAIFGLTKEPYIVFMTNALALLGLRQLYFLLYGLLDRLSFMSYGLSIILGFIGVKLVLHALHDNRVPFINGGQAVHVWEPSITFSLLFIVPDNRCHVHTEVHCIFHLIVQARRAGILLSHFISI